MSADRTHADARERLGELAGSVSVNELWCGAAQTALYDARDLLDGLLADLAAATERAAALTQDVETLRANLAAVLYNLRHERELAEARLAAAREALTDLEELRALVIEAYPGDSPTNYWRKRAEALNAWPGAALAVSPPDTGDTA